jgi:uncharacterized protein (DUF2267 family)
MPTHFDEYSQKGMEFLKQVAAKMNTPEDTAYADRLTTALFATIRDLITPEESLHLISSLPMYMKAHYVNGWKIHREKPRVKTREEFFELLREKYPRTTGRPMGDAQSLRNDVKAVFAVMRNYINPGELRHIQVQFPESLAELWDAETLQKEAAR